MTNEIRTDFRGKLFRLQWNNLCNTHWFYELCDQFCFDNLVSICCSFWYLEGKASGFLNFKTLLF